MYKKQEAAKLIVFIFDVWIQRLWKWIFIFFHNDGWDFFLSQLQVPYELTTQIWMSKWSRSRYPPETLRMKRAHVWKKMLFLIKSFIFFRWYLTGVKIFLASRAMQNDDKNVDQKNTEDFHAQSKHCESAETNWQR